MSEVIYNSRNYKVFIDVTAFGGWLDTIYNSRNYKVFIDPLMFANVHKILYIKDF